MKPTNERIGEKTKRKSQDCCVTFKLFFSVLFTFFMLPTYSMSVDNEVEAVVSDHLLNSKRCS